jgi:hypothetical protein
VLVDEQSREGKRKLIIGILAERGAGMKRSTVLCKNVSLLRKCSMRSFGYCLVAATFLVGIGGYAEATTILTFDGLTLPDGNALINGSLIPETYGDNMGTTPNITVDYRSFDTSGNQNGSPFDTSGSQDGMGFWGPNYGDLTNVAYPWFSKSFGQISLVAASGFVHLLSFDLAGYCATQINQPLRILDEGNIVLWELTPVEVLGVLRESHSTFSPDLTAATLHIQFGDTWNVGIDNINFEQVCQVNSVPDASILLLLGPGLVGLGILGRRKVFRK